MINYEALLGPTHIYCKDTYNYYSTCSSTYWSNTANLQVVQATTSPNKGGLS